MGANLFFSAGFPSYSTGRYSTLAEQVVGCVALQVCNQTIGERDAVRFFWGDENSPPTWFGTPEYK